MTAAELARRCEQIAKNYRTVYMWGSIGGAVTVETVSGRAAQYPDWYTAAKKSYLYALTGRGYFGFDCIGLIKSVLWNWSGDESAAHGGAGYGSNGVPDIGADGAIKICRDVTTDFTNEPPVGAALWMSGHIGVYIGGGLGVECTPSWADGVQVTAVANRGAVAGYQSRRWTKWGLLPWVSYEEKKEELNMTFEELMSVAGTGDNASAWASAAVAWAKANGIASGDGAGNYGWDKPITREGLAQMLFNFEKYLEKLKVES